MNKYQVQINFTVQRASEKDCEKFRQPLGSIEILEPDGTRHAWANSEQDALDKIHDYMYDILGYSDAFEVVKVEDQS